MPIRWLGSRAPALGLLLLAVVAGAARPAGGMEKGRGGGGRSVREAGGHPPEDPPLRPTPYADLEARPYAYHGSRRDLPDPVGLDQVRLGLFIPLRGRDAAAGISMRRGAELAVAEGNATGGYQGTPFALLIRPSDQVWGSAREVVRLAYEDQVWAVIGATGGQSTHVAQQVITKAQLPLLSPAATDASLTQINIPWMFRLMPDDEAIAELLANHLFTEQQYTRVVVLASSSYDSRLRQTEVEQQARRHGRPLALSLVWQPGKDPSSQLRRLAAVPPEAVVLLGRPREVVPVLAALREQLPAVPVFAGPELASDAFPALAGELAEGIVVAAPCDLWRDEEVLPAPLPHGPAPHADRPLHASPRPSGRLPSFRHCFSQRYGEQPDMVAAYTYDATSLLIAAIRTAGLNRARIRDALASGQPFPGVTGEITFDGSGGSTAEPVLAVIRGGRFERFRLGFLRRSGGVGRRDPGGGRQVAGVRRQVAGAPTPGTRRPPSDDARHPSVRSALTLARGDSTATTP